MRRTMILMPVIVTMGFVQLPGAFRPVEFMTFAGNTKQSDGH
jgi:hypothetical protein